MRLKSCGNLAAMGTLTALLLSGCGGGGGGGAALTPGPPPAGSYDLQKGWAALITTGLTTTVSLSGTAIANGSTYAFTGTGTYTVGAAASGTFNGATVELQSESLSGTVTVSGLTTPVTTTGTNAFEPGTSAILGQISGAEYDVAGAPLAIPASIGTAPVTLGSLIRYTDSTLSVPEGTVQVSVAVTQVPVDTGSSEVVRFTFTTYDASHALISTDTYDYLLTEGSVLTFHGAGSQTAQGTLTVTPQ
jgi:hypothetical protein